PKLELNARYAHVGGFPNGKIGVQPDPAAQQAAEELIARVTDPAARELLSQSLSAPNTASIEIPREQVTLSARLSWPVSDLFFSVMPTIKASRSSLRAAQAQQRAQDARVKLTARESFYQLARARGNLAVAQRALAQAEQQAA